MPQLSLYLDESTMEMLREKSERVQKSMSKYVAGLIQEDPSPRGWPEGYWDRVYGSITDPTFVAPPELDGSLDDIVLFD